MRGYILLALLDRMKKRETPEDRRRMIDALGRRARASRPKRPAGETRRRTVAEMAAGGLLRLVVFGCGFGAALLLGKALGL
jgi:hypothetical protein